MRLKKILSHLDQFSPFEQFRKIRLYTSLQTELHVELSVDFIGLEFLLVTVSNWVYGDEEFSENKIVNTINIIDIIEKIENLLDNHQNVI